MGGRAPTAEQTGGGQEEGARGHRCDQLGRVRREAQVVYEPLVSHGLKRGNAPTRNDEREGAGHLLKPLFRNDPHQRVGAQGLRALADGDGSVAGAPVEDGLGRDEVEQRRPRVGDHGHGSLLVFPWHTGWLLLTIAVAASSCLTGGSQTGRRESRGSTVSPNRLGGE